MHAMPCPETQCSALQRQAVMRLPLAPVRRLAAACGLWQPVELLPLLAGPASSSSACTRLCAPHPPTHPASAPLFCAAAGTDLLIVSRAAFAPWARNADAPLNEYYNNHNSNTVAFHRRVHASMHGCMHARTHARVHACWGACTHNRCSSSVGAAIGLLAWAGGLGVVPADLRLTGLD
jgi:hypothetical protein